VISFRHCAAKGLQVGDSFTITRCFTEEDIRLFAKFSGDYSSVHFDASDAQIFHFKTPIPHGLTATPINEIGGQIGWMALSMTLHYTDPVYVGDAITCRWVIKEVDETGHAMAAITITNEVGDTVLEAETTGVVSGVVERKV